MVRKYNLCPKIILLERKFLFFDDNFDSRPKFYFTKKNRYKSLYKNAIFMLPKIGINFSTRNSYHLKRMKLKICEFFQLVTKFSKSTLEFQNLKITKLSVLIKPIKQSRVLNISTLISIKQKRIVWVPLNILLFNNWQFSNARRFINSSFKMMWRSPFEKMTYGGPVSLWFFFKKF